MAEELGLLDATRPEGECINWDAWSGESENEECNEIWKVWNERCDLLETDDDCSDVFTELLWSYVLLAEAGEPATGSQASFGADFAKGAATGAIAALGAIYVMRMCCNKAQDSGAFHRV